MFSDVFKATPKGAPAATAGELPERLQGNMGTVQLVCLVLAFNAPLALMVASVPLVIGYGTGLGTPLLFVLMGALFAIFAIGFTAMSRMIPRTGALYTFVTAGLGRPIGLGASFLALVVYTSGGLYGLLFVGPTIESMVVNTFNGPDLPWWLYCLIFAAIVGVLCYLNVDVSARVIGVLLFLEVGVLVVYYGFVLAKGGAVGELHPPSLDPGLLTSGGFAIGVLFAMIAFVGFETTAIFRDEVRDSTKVVPRATYLSIASLTVIYAVGSWLLIEGVGRDAALGAIATSPGTAFLENAQLMMGKFGYDVINILFVTSSLATLVTLQNVISRYLFNLGSDGVLPRLIGMPHRRFGSPHRASLLLSIISFGFIIVTAVAGADPIVVFTKMAGATGYALLALYALAGVAIAAYLLRNRSAGVNVWQRAIASVIAAVGMIAILIVGTKNLDLMSGSRTLSIIAIGVVVVSVSLAVAVAMTLRSTRPEVYERIGTEY